MFISNLKLSIFTLWEVKMFRHILTCIYFDVLEFNNSFGSRGIVNIWIKER